MDRRLLAGLAVLALVATVGCTGFGGGGPNQEALAENATYDWDADAETEIRLSEGGVFQPAEYQVVYSGNASSIELYTRGFTRDHAVPIRAVQYRYATNDTVAGHEAVEVSQTARRTTVHLPEAEGQLAFSGERHDQELHLRTFDDGDVRVVLPSGHTVGDVLLGHVVPRGYETGRTTDDRLALTWEEVEADRSLLVRHYRERDWLLFYGLLAVMGVAAVIGYAYFSREIRKIQRRREEAGLDVDHDDDRRRPPPGMG